MTHENIIAYFVSPHGFGHAARACAVMDSIHEINKAVRFEIFTKVPEWFFENSLSGSFRYHSLLTDIGLAQKNSLYEDIDKTIRQLDNFLPFDSSHIDILANQIIQLSCRLVICDIAPMGIAVARKARIPSILVENFTWDWIYEAYANNTKIYRHINYLRNLFLSADYHIQTQPVCCVYDADLTTVPVSRKIKHSSISIRTSFGIPLNSKAVLITMGGIKERYTFLHQLADCNEVYFIIPGAMNKEETTEVESRNLILLPHASDFFHPDIVNACDAVIGKVGYSTLAEVYYAGCPFGYVTRPFFRESEALTAYIEKHMPGVAIHPDQFYNAGWIDILQSLLSIQRVQRYDSNGANTAANFIYNLLELE